MTIPIYTNEAEVVLFVVAWLALFAVTWSMWAARADHLRVSRDPKSHPRARFTMGAIYHSSKVTVAAHVVIVFASSWGIFNQPPPPNYMEVPQSAVNICAWIAVAGLLCYQALRSAHWRGIMTKGDYTGY